MGHQPLLAGRAHRHRPEHDPEARARRRRYLTPGLALPLAALLAAGAPAAGADRVRIEVGACVLEAPPPYTAQAEELGRRAGAILDRLSRDLGAAPAGPFTIVLLPPRPIREADLARLDATAPEWAAGFLDPGTRRGGLRVEAAERYPYGDLEAVFAHEAAHQILHDASGGNLPRWFDEGVATREGRRWNLRDVLVYSSAVLTGGLPTLDELDPAFAGSAARARAAYAASSDFVGWMVQRRGEAAIGEVVRASRRMPFADAWSAAMGVSLADAEAAWRRGSLLRYRWIPAIAGGTSLWVGITALALLAGAKRRARDREIAERWEEEAGGEDPSGRPGGDAASADPPEPVH